MHKLQISQTITTPEIFFSPGENIFFIRGNSSPEDVRALYYPIIEWIRIFTGDVLEGAYKTFNNKTPVEFQIDLSYFNSSSAKFLFDIFSELKKLPEAGFPLNVNWCYDEEDSDMKEAGSDIALLVGMEFTYTAKPRKV
jgi:hypothetical protein